MEVPQSKQANLAEAPGMSLNRSKSHLPGLGWGGRSRKETVVISKMQDYKSTD